MAAPQHPIFNKNINTSTGESNHSSSILPPANPEERFELDAVMKESLRAARIPSLAVTIDPMAVTPSPSTHPAAKPRRFVQAAVALGVGIAASAAFSYFASHDADSTLVAEPETQSGQGADIDTSAGTAPAALPVVEAAPEAVATPTAVEDRDDMLEVPDAESDTAARPSTSRAERTSRTSTTTARSVATATATARTTAPAAIAPAVAPSQPASEAVAEDPLRTALTRDDVRNGMESIRPSIEECAAGAHGMLELQLTIDPRGRVVSSLVEGAFVGMQQGSCMARTARRARFPAFAGEAVTVRYPYSL